MGTIAHLPSADCLVDLPLPAIVLSPHGSAVYHNPAYRVRFGARERAIDDGGSAPKPPSARQVAVALRGGRQSAVRAAMAGVSRVVPIAPTGSPPLDAHYFPMRDASGAASLVGVILVEHRGGTAMPLSSRGALRPRGEAADVERNLRRILDGMPQLVWSTRPDGYHDFYNRRWYEYTGADPAVTRGAGWNDPLHPDDQQRSWERWQRSLETGEDYEIEYRFRRADGEYRWFLGRALPLRDEGGRIVRWFGTCTDVDDQKRLEQRRAEVLAQAEATSRLKDEFLAIVSHELRTPLTAILGWARIQRTRPELAAKAIQVIERNAEAQAKLIEEILETSRIVTGKIRLHPGRADPNDIVRAAVDTIGPAADAKGVALDVSLDPDVPRLAGDVDRLRQVVLNLLVNALKFTPSGGRVSVRTDAAARSSVVITVADTGTGIAADFLPHVFERFRQGEGATTRQHGGLGLGLSIVKHLVELHGGTISAASEGEGRGATFAVRLPVRAVSALPAESARAEPAGPRLPFDPAARLDRVRVLVVDDEPDARELVSMVLREAGAETREADSASSALAAIDEELPDVLISDIGMPLQDGYRLLRELRARALDRGGAVPAVALTAFTRSEDVDRAIDAGFQLHLAKPIEPPDLVAAVHHLARSAWGASEIGRADDGRVACAARG
jgi:PAS domain S-box-containing protein